MNNVAIDRYYRQVISTLTGLQKEYAFTKRYQREDEIIVVEFFLTEENGRKNITLEEIIFHAISGEAHAGNISFVLHHVEVINQFNRDEESVSCGKVLHTLGETTVPAIFNKQSLPQENHYDWCYMGNDNILYTAVDLEYLMVTFWPSGKLFKEAAEMMLKIIDALDQWCPHFHLHKDTLCHALFKNEAAHD